MTNSDVEAQEIVQFLPGRPMRRKLDWLLRLTTPNNLLYELRVVPKRRRLSLGDQLESYLGYATYVCGAGGTAAGSRT